MSNFSLTGNGASVACKSHFILTSKPGLSIYDLPLYSLPHHYEFRGKIRDILIRLLTHYYGL